MRVRESLTEIESSAETRLGIVVVVCAIDMATISDSMRATRFRICKRMIPGRLRG